MTCLCLKNPPCLMMKIWYFNPENDLALANGGLNYTAPPRAAQLRHDLRLLPAWLASPGDRVLCNDVTDRDWLLQQGLGVDIITPAELPSLSVAEFVPWGWSRATRRTLQRLGAPEHLLPSAERIEAVHRLAHRRTSIAMHRLLQHLMGPDLCPTPVELFTLDAVKDWAAKHPGCYLKLPWSGSGQGVYRVLDMNDAHLWQWCHGGLRRQGSILCEQGLERIQDFATEWLCREGTARLVGFSVFENDFHHQYAGGIVDSHQALHSRIAMLYPDIDKAVDALSQAIEQLIAPDYDGHLGVDMMLYHHPDGHIALNPCVEVNLRCTMGLVCSALGDRHGLRGTYRITAAPHPTGRSLTPPAHFAASVTDS